MKMHPVGVELFHADGQTHRQTDGRTDRQKGRTWYFSGHASWIDYILVTNLMHWLLFIH